MNWFEKLIGYKELAGSINTSLSTYCAHYKNGRREALRAGWEEFAGVVRLKVYWASFIAIGLIIAWTGSFDSMYIEAIPLRFGAIIGFLLFSGFTCAAIAGLCRAIAGVSSLRKFETVIKIAAFWVLIATVPARLMINYLGDMPITTVSIMRSAIHGSSIAFLVIVVMYLFGQRKYLAKRKLAREVELAREEQVLHEEKLASEVEAVENPVEKGNTEEKKEIRTEKKQTEEIAPRRLIPSPFYIVSEDHYLKIVYLGREEFIRANLTEVASRLGQKGFRCHKSYWVSRSAIDKRRRQGRRLLLILKDGTEIPVGRSFEKSVRSFFEEDLFFA